MQIDAHNIAVKMHITSRCHTSGKRHAPLTYMLYYLKIIIRSTANNIYNDSMKNLIIKKKINGKPIVIGSLL